MFNSGHWAAAFINSLEKEGAEIEDGVEFLKILTSWAKKLPGDVSGGSAAKKMEKVIRDGITKNGGVLAAGQETVLRTFLLMVQKNVIRHIDLVFEKIKEFLDKKYGVVTAFVEYAFPAGEAAASPAAANFADESRIKEEIKKRTAAVRVDLTEHFNPELIGGYRLRIGDEIIDASVRSQLRKLSDHLTDWTD